MSKFSSRRRILTSFSAGMLASVIPIYPEALQGQRWYISKLRKMLQTCGCEEIAGMLGRTCLTQHIADVSAGVTEKATRSFDRAIASGTGFAEWYHAETISDFDTGRVMRVDGWVISQTEFWIFSSFAANVDT